MKTEEIVSLIQNLDRWFKDQNIKDEYAAIAMAEVVALIIFRNFDDEGQSFMIARFAELMAGAFARLKTAAIEGRPDEEKRLN